MLNQKDKFTELAGISLPIRISCGKISFKDDLLFTHHGLSGPAVLQISSYWTKGKEISIDLFPQNDISKTLKLYKSQKDKRKLSSCLSKHFPKRFAQFICTKFQLEKPISEMKDSDLYSLAEQLHRWKITPAGTQGYPVAEVTCGGVDTKEISSQTLESKRESGLFFIGETLDITGYLGGYNLQWAWSSGAVVGRLI